MMSRSQISCVYCVWDEQIFYQCTTTTTTTATATTTPTAAAAAATTAGGVSHDQSE